MIERFENKLFEWISANGLYDGVERVLLAVSGGADSMAMLHALIELRKQGRLSCEFIIGHVNHGLRGAESDADERFVREWSGLRGIPIVVTSVDVRGYADNAKLSIETAGRMLRLEALAAMARSQNCDGIATAHHKDDLAETMVHRILRGTGIRGLCGIWPVSDVYGGKFIRPMLGVRRDEMIRYCTENGIRWREDASNRNVTFTRNRIRHRLMPYLEAESGKIVDKLVLLSGRCREVVMRTEKLAGAIVDKGRLEKEPGTFNLDKAMLEKCPPWVLHEVLRQVLVKLEVGLRDYTEPHFDEIRRMLVRDKAKGVFPGRVEIRVEKGALIVRKGAESEILSAEPVTLDLNQTVQFGPWKISCRLLNRNEIDAEQFFNTKNAFVEWFDADKIRGRLEIRPRQAGDRFRPLGGRGEKKVARFLQDGQLDAEARQNAFIAADAEKILWVAPLRMSEQVKVSPETKKILEIKVCG